MITKIGNDVYLSYNTYSILCIKLINQIKEHVNFDKLGFVYGFSRGGLPLAVHLSHFLNLKFIDDEKCLKCIVENQPDKLILICDDIVDTGKTISKLFERLFGDFYTNKVDRFLIASLTHKKESLLKPDFSAFITEPNEWVIFPWEETK